MPEAQLISHTPVIKVGGAELTAEDYDDVVDVRVELSVHVPDRFTLRFRDPDFELFDGTTFAIGKAVEIGFAVPSEQPVTVLKKAEITSITIEQNAGDRPVLVVAGYDKGHRLARQTVVKTYVKQKDSDIASAIAGRYGLAADADATAVRHEYLAQNETDYAFLTERARANGYNWWVADGKLYFKRNPTSAGGTPTLKLGEDLRKFKVRISADLADDYQVHGWDDTKKKAIVGNEKMVTSLDFVGTDAKLIKDISGKKAFAASKRSIGHVPVHDPAEANVIAKSLALRAAGEQVIARGEAVHHPELKAGGKVKIEQAGDKASGTYVLTSVEHVWGGGQALATRFVSGGKEAASLVDLLGGAQASSARGSGPGWGRLGVVIGLVTNTQDPENLGRVKVKLPTMGMDDSGVEIESTWARVLTMGAGKQRGLWWMPEIDDEVLVVFEHGDLRRPVVLGGLWNTKDKPPGATTDMFKNGKVVAYTLTSESGHVLLIGQKADEEMISLYHKDGTTRLVLGEKGVILETKDQDITVKGGGKISFDAKKDFEVSAQNIKFTAKQAYSVEAKTDFKAEALNVTVKAKASLKAEGGATAEIKGAMLKLQASGIAELKGSMVKIN